MLHMLVGHIFSSALLLYAIQRMGQVAEIRGSFYAGSSHELGLVTAACSAVALGTVVEDCGYSGLCGAFWLYLFKLPTSKAQSLRGSVALLLLQDELCSENTRKLTYPYSTASLSSSFARSGPCVVSSLLPFQRLGRRELCFAKTWCQERVL